MEALIIGLTIGLSALVYIVYDVIHFDTETK